MAEKKYVRDKEAKVDGILASTKRLIEDEGYENVTVRDISREAGVSIGLIYKYFPEGKPGRPEHIDFNDFPGYLKGFFTANLAYYRNNRRFLSALSIATITDSKIFEGHEDIGEEKMRAITGFFGSFPGVDFSDKGEPWQFLAKWSALTKSIMLYNTVYPSPFESDEELVELLVRISLMMWGYKE
jgi:AcrR family transcriptional regulator